MIRYLRPQEDAMSDYAMNSDDLFEAPLRYTRCVMT